MISDAEIMAQVLEVFQGEQVEHRQAICDILLDLERYPDHANYETLVQQLFREAHSLKGGARAAGLESVERIAHSMEDLFGVVRAGKLSLKPDVCDMLYASLDAIGHLMQEQAAGEPMHMEQYESLLTQLRGIAGTEDPAAMGEEAGVAEASPSTSLPQQAAPPFPTPYGGARGDEPVLENKCAPDAVYVDHAEGKNDVDTVCDDCADCAQDTINSANDTDTVHTDYNDCDGEMTALTNDTDTVHASYANCGGETIALTNDTGTVKDNLSDRAEETPAPVETLHATSLPHEDQPTQTGSKDEPFLETTNTTVRLSTATLDILLNEAGELITSAARERQYAREARVLLGFSTRWNHIWRHVQHVVKRIRNQKGDFEPTVHHLQDRVQARNILAQTGQYGQAPLDKPESSINGDTMILVEALLQANNIIKDMEQRLVPYVRQTTEEAARLSAITSQLHDHVRSTRMLPLTTILQPVRVQVRDMARSSGKHIYLDVDDGQAVADREVLENVREVLLHLMRNAVDHGIESIDKRVAQGKPEEGRIALYAAVHGDYLELTIADDGAGLDIEAIKQQACTGGFLKETDIERMSDADIVDLIFASGFSTSKRVSTLSGRGVGLDIVRSRVERMQGHVSVKSIAKQSTTFTIRVPLSLTSSHGLLLKIEQTTYMLPLEVVQRIVAVTPKDIAHVEGYETLLVDGHPVKLLYLAELLGESAHIISEGQAGRRGSAAALYKGSGMRQSMALLLGNGERQIACLIDDVLGEQELVVHRLPSPLHRVRFIAGATLLEDGSIVPILDAVDILRAATGRRSSGVVVDEQTSVNQHTPTIVVADDSITTRTLEKNILEAAGYQVHMATDGVQALNVLHTLMGNGGCDLLLSDIDMPNLDGFELTKQVCGNPELRHVPVILVTSLDAPQDRERGMSAGASAYIVKRGFDQQLLLETIAELV